MTDAWQADAWQTDALQTAEFRPDRFGLDAVLQLAYAVCFVLVAGLMPLDHPLVWA